MYTIIYQFNEYKDRTGKERTKVKKFEKEQDARDEVKKLQSTLYNFDIQILVPLENDFGYKAKFEELYDHLLTSSGIRKAELPPKKVI